MIFRKPSKDYVLPVEGKGKQSFDQVQQLVKEYRLNSLDVVLDDKGKIDIKSEDNKKIVDWLRSQLVPESHDPLKAQILSSETPYLIQLYRAIMIELKRRDVAL